MDVAHPHGAFAFHEGVTLGARVSELRLVQRSEIELTMARWLAAIPPSASRVQCAIQRELRHLRTTFASLLTSRTDASERADVDALLAGLAEPMIAERRRPRGAG